MMRWIQQRLAELTGREDGTSLAELLMGMTLMVIFGSIFTGAILLMNGSANKTESVTLTSNTLNTAFLKLDKTVRYATAVSLPGVGATSGDWYVELRSTYTGSEVCTQLQADVSTQQLRSRTWTVVNSAATGLTGWTPLASNITNGAVAGTSADVPFTVNQPSTSVSYQTLKITLVSTAGSTAVTTSRSSVTFTAQNSTAATTSTNVCNQSLTGGLRP
jgi:hypothetical protein